MHPADGEVAGFLFQAVTPEHRNTNKPIRKKVETCWMVHNRLRRLGWYRGPGEWVCGCTVMKYERVKECQRCRYDETELVTQVVVARQH
jgi:hypothetical protein